MTTMMRLMTFHFSSTVPGGLLFSQWTVQGLGGESDPAPREMSSKDLTM